MLASSKNCINGCLLVIHHMKIAKTKTKSSKVESRLEGVNRANLKFINLSTTTSRVSVRNMNESEREGEKQIVSK
jgi:ribosomal protein L34E